MGEDGGGAQVTWQACWRPARALGRILLGGDVVTSHQVLVWSALGSCCFFILALVMFNLLSQGTLALLGVSMRKLEPWAFVLGLDIWLLVLSPQLPQLSLACPQHCVFITESQVDQAHCLREQISHHNSLLASFPGLPSLLCE